MCTTKFSQCFHLLTLSFEESCLSVLSGAELSCNWWSTVVAGASPTQAHLIPISSRLNSIEVVVTCGKGILQAKEHLGGIQT